MKKIFLIAVIFIATVVAIIAWHFWALRTERATHPNVDPHVGNALELKVAPKKVPSVASAQSASALSTKNSTPYEQFKERKLCFENAGTPSDISQEIAALHRSLPKASSQYKTALENQIHNKEMQLDVLARCGDVPVTKDELSRLLEKAALQGDPAAQFAYALDPMIDRNHAIENLDRLRIWRGAALGYVKSAADQGNPEAMIALAGAYDPLQCRPANKPFCSIMLPQIVNPNAETAYRYYYESKVAGDGSSWVEAELKTLEEYLTQAQIVAAQNAAKSRH